MIPFLLASVVLGLVVTLVTKSLQIAAVAAVVVGALIIYISVVQG